MPSTSRKSIYQRAVAWVLLLCLLSASLLFGMFILTHAEHEHDHTGFGGSCAACLQLQNAENALRVLGAAAVVGFALLTATYAAAPLVRLVRSIPTILTPITAKTRSNN